MSGPSLSGYFSQRSGFWPAVGKALKRLWRGPDSRRGVAAIEFGLVALPFVMLIIGIFEFGRYFWIQTSLERAVETGGQYVYTHTTTPLTQLKPMIPDQVKAALVGIDSNLVTVPTPEESTLTSSSGSTITFLTISASYTFAFIDILGIGPITISARTKVPVM